MAGEVPVVPPAEAPAPAAAPAPAPVPAAVVEAAPAPAPEAVPPQAPVAEAAPAPVEAPALATAQPTLFEKFDLEQAAKAVADKKAADPEAPPAAEVPKEGEAAEVKEPPAEGDQPKEVKAEEKPAEPAKDGDQPAAEEKPAEAAPVEPPKVELSPIKFEFTLPEEFKLPDEQRGAVEGILSDFRADPSAANQQKLIDFHVERIQEVRSDMERYQHDVFGRVRDGWSKEVKADPEIGGNNHDAAMQAIAYVRDNFVSTAERGSKEYEAARKSFDEFMHYTGAGDNPAFLRWAHNLAQALNEPEMRATSEISPIPQQETGGRPPIYKHPTSQRNGR